MTSGECCPAVCESCGSLRAFPEEVLADPEGVIEAFRRLELAARRDLTASEAAEELADALELTFGRGAPISAVAASVLERARVAS